MIKPDFERDGIQLYCADCMDVLPHLSGVDAVVTDPPYGIGIASNPVRQAHEKMDWDESPPDASVIAAVSKASKVSIIWGGNYFHLPATQCVLIWDKVQPENFSLAMCEIAWTNLKKPSKIFQKRVVGYDKVHPTQKPVDLMEWCILQINQEVETICDPFMGSGTTIVAAVKLGKRAIGIERERKYFDIAVKRIERALSEERSSLFPVSKEIQRELI